MKHFEEETIPAKTIKSLTKTTCDMCGQEITEGMYEVDEVEIRHKTGTNYPEGGYGEEVEVDMCGICFDEKLIPWLKSEGVKVTSRGWDW